MPYRNVPASVKILSRLGICLLLTAQLVGSVAAQTPMPVSNPPPVIVPNAASVGPADTIAPSTTAVTPPTPAAATLPAPISPTNKEIVASRGVVHVQWQPRPGASTYGYEAEFNAFGSWTAVGKADGISRGRNDGSITLDKYFVRQYGPAGVPMRWHVWVVAPGGKRGDTSAWAEFTFKASGNVNFRDVVPPPKRRRAMPKKTMKKKSVTKRAPATTAH